MNIDLSNSLVPLPESVLTKICYDILSHWAPELTLTGVANLFCGTDCLMMIFNCIRQLAVLCDLCLDQVKTCVS